MSTKCGPDCKSEAVTRPIRGEAMHKTLNIILAASLILMVIWSIGDLINASPAKWTVGTLKAIGELVN